MLEGFGITNKKFWKFWGLTLIIISAIFIAEMDVAPYLDEDEFMIVDLGRIILHPETGWSITWMMDRNEPAFVFFYIGPVIFELSYQLLGEFGPRLLGLLGALFASTMILLWLKSRNTKLLFAAILSLVFLLDPVFVQSYTLGRLDGWAIGFCLLACCILRSGLGKESVNGQIIAAGVCFSLALFVWPSAAFLFPLILGELYFLMISQNVHQNFKVKILKPLSVFSITVVIVSVALLIPIATKFYAYFTNILDGILVNVFRGQNVGEQSGQILSLDPALELLRGLKYTPVLFILAITAAILKRDLVLILSSLAAILMMYLTVVYLHRIQYLLPYLVALTAGLYQERSFNTGLTILKLRTSNLKYLSGAVLLFWVVAVSLVIRSFLAIENSQERDRDLVFQAAVNMIGPGDHHVYISAPEFYIAGRTLGWKMFRRYGAIGDPLTSESIKPIVPKMEYVILREWEVTENFDSLLDEKGFSRAEWYTLYKEPVSGFDGQITNEHRLRNLFSIFEHPYGPYKLYSRQAD
ncbi:hypothetical protein ML462_06155 [Gramella lutea]|uniref:Uncharacterized protein n=1 Tax=Christiangramia lutea TaxID=1607951 RepID=A0A9X1V2C7_9FLAO|nr:hypothetical protein [Christiangramia lutea]MCH4822751.1 hypothetical protein [Christiangramia lutea]